MNVDGCLSDRRLLFGGVPQGPILRPLLSLFYIMGIANGLANPCLVFAVDIKQGHFWLDAMKQLPINTQTTETWSFSSSDI